MSSKEIAPLSEEELRRFFLSMGSPPVLSTEDPKAFEELFFDIARPLKNPDRLSLCLVWEIAVDTWSNARYARHETIAVTRWWDKFHDSQLVSARTMKLTYEESLRKQAAGLTAYSAGAAQAAELQERIDNTAKDIAAIIARVPTEADFNQALRANADFLHVLDQLKNGANRRRFSNCVLDPVGSPEHMSRTLRSFAREIPWEMRFCTGFNKSGKYSNCLLKYLNT